MQIIDRGAVMVEQEDLEIQPKMFWLLLGIAMLGGLIIGGCLGALIVQGNYLEHAKGVQNYIETRCICQNVTRSQLPLDTKLNFSLNILSND
jgi:hypothetical protein